MSTEVETITTDMSATMYFRAVLLTTIWRHRLTAVSHKKLFPPTPGKLLVIVWDIIKNGRVRLGCSIFKTHPRILGP